MWKIKSIRLKNGHENENFTKYFLNRIKIIFTQYCLSSNHVLTNNIPVITCIMGWWNGCSVYLRNVI